MKPRMPLISTDRPPLFVAVTRASTIMLAATVDQAAHRLAQLLFDLGVQLAQARAGAVHLFGRQGRWTARLWFWARGRLIASGGVGRNDGIVFVGHDGTLPIRGLSLDGADTDV